MNVLDDEKRIMRADMMLEQHIRNSYDAFYEFTATEREEALKALKKLKNLYKLYGHEFDLRDLGDEL